MVKFVFDANIPIAFSKIGRFGILEKLFSVSAVIDTELTMAVQNLNECTGGLSENICSNLEKFTSYDGTQDTAYNTCLNNAKKYFDAIKKNCQLHTKNDADFHFIATAMLNKPDYLLFYEFPNISVNKV